MSRACSICSHPQRGEIDAALVAGQSLRDLAKQFDATKSALSRHKTDHLNPSKANGEETMASQSDQQVLIADGFPRGDEDESHSDQPMTEVENESHVDSSKPEADETTNAAFTPDEDEFMPYENESVDDSPPAETENVSIDKPLTPEAKERLRTRLDEIRADIERREQAAEQAAREAEEKRQAELVKQHTAFTRSGGYPENPPIPPGVAARNELRKVHKVKPTTKHPRPFALDAEGAMACEVVVGRQEIPGSLPIVHRGAHITRGLPWVVDFNKVVFDHGRFTESGALIIPTSGLYSVDLDLVIRSNSSVNRVTWKAWISINGMLRNPPIIVGNLATALNDADGEVWYKHAQAALLLGEGDRLAVHLQHNVATNVFPAGSRLCVSLIREYSSHSRETRHAL